MGVPSSTQLWDLQKVLPSGAECSLLIPNDFQSGFLVSTIFVSFHFFVSIHFVSFSLSNYNKAERVPYELENQVRTVAT